MRTFSSALLGILALLLLLSGCLTFASYDNAVRTVASKRQLLGSFESAVGFIDGFEEREGRLPTQEDLDIWTQTIPKPGVNTVHGIEITAAPDSPLIDRERARELGPIPPGSYVLGYWEGDHMEYYAGWSRCHTLPLQPSDFYVFGSPSRDGLAQLVAGLGVGFLAGLVAVWRRSPKLAV